MIRHPHVARHTRLMRLLHNASQKERSADSRATLREARRATNNGTPHLPDIRERMIVGVIRREDSRRMGTLSWMNAMHPREPTPPRVARTDQDAWLHDQENASVAAIGGVDPQLTDFVG
jgi:hypothetical protein